MSMSISRTPIVGSWPRHQLENFEAYSLSKGFAFSIEENGCLMMPTSESEFCKNYTCCGQQLADLHDLLQHYEEAHVVFLSDESDSIINGGNNNDNSSSSVILNDQNNNQSAVQNQPSNSKAANKSTSQSGSPPSHSNELSTLISSNSNNTKIGSNSDNLNNEDLNITNSEDASDLQFINHNQIDDSNDHQSMNSSSQFANNNNNNPIPSTSSSSISIGSLHPYSNQFQSSTDSAMDLAEQSDSNSPFQNFLPSSVSIHGSSGGSHSNSVQTIHSINTTNTTTSNGVIKRNSLTVGLEPAFENSILRQKPRTLGKAPFGSFGPAGSSHFQNGWHNSDAPFPPSLSTDSDDFNAIPSYPATPGDLTDDMDCDDFFMHESVSTADLMSNANATATVQPGMLSASNSRSNSPHFGSLAAGVRFSNAINPSMDANTTSALSLVQQLSSQHHSQQQIISQDAKQSLNLTAEEEEEDDDDDDGLGEGKKPFKCPNISCSKSYRQANGLKYHVMKGQCNLLINNAMEDGMTYAEAEAVARPYVCAAGNSACMKRYKNLNGLRYHYQHSGAHGEVGLALLAAGQHPPPSRLTPRRPGSKPPTADNSASNSPVLLSKSAVALPVLNTLNHAAIPSRPNEPQSALLTTDDTIME